MIAAITAFLAQLFSNLWNGVLTAIYTVAQWFLDLVTAVAVFCVELFGGLLVWLLGLLPRVPENLPTTGPIPELFAAANYYAPVSEVVGFLAVLAAVYVIRGTIEFVKFLRGA